MKAGWILRDKFSYGVIFARLGTRTFTLAQTHRSAL